MLKFSLNYWPNIWGNYCFRETAVRFGLHKEKGRTRDGNDETNPGVLKFYSEMYSWIEANFDGFISRN